MTTTKKNALVRTIFKIMWLVGEKTIFRAGYLCSRLFAFPSVSLHQGRYWRESIYSTVVDVPWCSASTTACLLVGVWGLRDPRHPPLYKNHFSEKACSNKLARRGKEDVVVQHILTHTLPRSAYSTGHILIHTCLVKNRLTKKLGWYFTGKMRNLKFELRHLENSDRKHPL